MGRILSSLVALTLSATAALASDPCTPLRGTDQYSRCQTDQLLRLSSETAAMQSEALAKGLTPRPRPVYPISPETPPLSPYQEGYAAQQRTQMQRQQQSLTQRTLQLQRDVGRSVTRPVPRPGATFQRPLH